MHPWPMLSLGVAYHASRLAQGGLLPAPLQDQRLDSPSSVRDSLEVCRPASSTVIIVRTSRGLDHRIIRMRKAAARKRGACGSRPRPRRRPGPFRGRLAGEVCEGTYPCRATRGTQASRTRQADSDVHGFFCTCGAKYSRVTRSAGQPFWNRVASKETGLATSTRLQRPASPKQWRLHGQPHGGNEPDATLDSLSRRDG